MADSRTAYENEEKKAGQLKELQLATKVLQQEGKLLQSKTAALGKEVINSMSPTQQATLTPGEKNINKPEGPDEGPLRIE